jgi:NAD(P)-dependent dehydrogenase (short-subunit alcohol dehydrogenase family)
MGENIGAAGRKAALVTGANKGIGLEVSRQQQVIALRAPNDTRRRKF